MAKFPETFRKDPEGIPEALSRGLRTKPTSTRSLLRFRSARS